MRISTTCCLLAVALWLPAACSSAGSMPSDSGLDLPADTRSDSGTNLPFDAREDGETDLQFDGGSDGGTDLGSDGGTDLGLDGGTDPGLDGGTDHIDGEICQQCEPPSPLWAHSIGGEMADMALAMATASDGAVVVGGHTGSAEFHVDDVFQVSTGVEAKRKVFVSRFAPDGQPQWTNIYGGPGDDRLRAAAFDSKGAAIIAGLTIAEPEDDHFAFDETSHQLFGGLDAYYAKISEEGEVLFSNVFGGEGDELLLAAAADYEDNVLVGGSFSSTFVDLGSGPVQNSQDTAQHDVLVARLTPAGDPIWTRAFGGPGADYVHSIAADDAGNVYVTGGISVYGMTVGAEELTSAGERDIWVAKLDPAGEPLWARSFGGKKHDAAHALAVSPAGDVYVTGSLQSEMVNFGGENIYHVGSVESHDIFLIKLDTDGNHVWSHGFGGVEWDLAKSVTLGPDETVYITGALFSPALSLGGEELTGAGPGNNEVDALAAAYDSDGQHLWSYTFGGPDNDFGYWISAAPSGALALGGTFNGTSDGDPLPAGTIDPGGGPLVPIGGRDSFVVRFY